MCDRWHRYVVHALATGFGLGRIPKAPGTFGSCAGVPLGVVLNLISSYSMLASVGLFIVLAIGSVKVIASYEQITGSHDSSEVVIDEIMGLSLVFIWVPVSVMCIGFSFVLFRLFDISKIGPVGWVERRLSGSAWGTLLDDVVAGVMVTLIMIGVT